GLGFLIVGMVAVPTTAVMALWRYRIADKHSKIADKQTNIDQQRNRAEALAKASDLLGNGEVAAQQGGLFALGQLARSSKEDHPDIMKIVAGFIRHRAPVPPPPSPAPVRAVEVEAAATVIRDRELDHDTKLDDLVKRKEDGTLEEKEWRFDLSGIQLNNIDFTRVDMSVVNMSDSVFKGCIFERANFSEANLTKANLSDSDLGGATLKNADLTGADLSSAQGLTQAQVNDALGNKKGGGTEEATKLPDNIQFPEKWPECS
ncbi:MAG: pentapeptide repeat-containing protein, partial [Gammaproteobacteria bacterium]|nr:pentapeptide repeat-containing protein [Gammaproteobacteria bacterium]